MTLEQIPNQQKFDRHIDEIELRIAHAKKKFEKSEFTPFGSKRFKGFIVDYLSEITTRFILTGEVDPPSKSQDGMLDPDPKAAALKAAGFTVAGVPPIPGAKPVPGSQQTTATAAEEKKQKVINLDLTLAGMGAVQMAIGEGFDPTVKGDDE
jgi:hypothetical protein